MVLETILAWMETNPRLSIVILALAVTMISTLVTKWLTNQEHLHSLKKRQKEIQAELKNCKDDCEIKEMQMEMMKITGTMMKSSFKPLLVTFIPFIILFYWIRGFYGGEEPLLASWFWYYLGAGIVSSMIYRKIFKLA